MTTHTAHVQADAYKWLVLALAAFTFTFVVALPQMSLPVLFDEISAGMGLSLVQVGWIWGFGSVMGIVMGLIGGPVGDRFGPRWLFLDSQPVSFCRNRRSGAPAVLSGSMFEDNWVKIELAFLTQMGKIETQYLPLKLILWRSNE